MKCNSSGAAANGGGESLQDIQDYIDKNELKITYLQQLNAALKDRFDLQQQLASLSGKLQRIECDEREHSERHNAQRKAHLADLEHGGADLCAEHSRVLHQIEHIEWHLGHGHKHQHCQGAATAVSTADLTSRAGDCKSPGGGSAGSLVHHRSRGGGHAAQAHHKSHETLSLEHTSERLIKSIAELRRRIFGAKEKLEKEIQRKRCVEKSLSELRRDISRQKKIISTRRATPLPAIGTAGAGGGMGGGGGGGGGHSHRKSAFVQ